MSMEYRLKNKEWSCIISPKFGSNFISLHHNQYPIFREPKSLEELNRSPVLYGLPLLLPPNRTAGGRFVFDGQEYCLHEDKTLTKNYIHGEVKSTPFEVLKYAWDLLKTRLINRGEVFPFPFELEITDRLLDDGFHRDLTVKNIGTTDMPLVLGFHTTFTVPDSFSVAIGECWVEDENFIPTGEKRELTPQQQMYRDGCKLVGQRVRGFYEAKGNDARISSYRFKVEGFDQWILYNGDGNQGFLCIEPQLGPVNALNSGGYYRLRPGQTYPFSVKVSLAI